ncbi:MAG: transposase [Janthinobacterium lividum]
MSDRHLPLSQEFFAQVIEPLISSHYKRPGRPPKEKHYRFFYDVRVNWRDLPTCFGSRYTIYTRFKRWSENGLFWSLLYTSQQHKKVIVDFV